MMGTSTGGKRGAYLIGGGGWYRRTLEAKQTILQKGTVCAFLGVVEFAMCGRHFLHGYDGWFANGIRTWFQCGWRIDIWSRRIPG